MTSTISWHRMKIRTPSLKTGVISWITLTAQFIFSCLLSTSTATWQSMRRSSISIRRRMNLMTYVWSLPRCSITSWQKEITGWCVPNISHLGLKRRISGKHGQNWNVSSRIFWITLRSLGYLPIRWTERNGYRSCMKPLTRTAKFRSISLMTMYFGQGLVPRIMSHRPVLYLRMEKILRWAARWELFPIYRSLHRNLPTRCWQSFWRWTATWWWISISSPSTRWKRLSW